MNDLLSMISSAGVDAGTLALAGVAFGAFLAVLGVSGAFSAKDPVLQRMGRQGAARTASVADMGLLRPANADPSGLLKTLVPTDRKQRTEVERELAHAGMTGPNAVRNFYLVRLVLGIVLPAVLLGVIWASRAGHIALPERLDALFAGWSRMAILQIAAVTVAVGFYGPVYWMRSRAAKRRLAIEQSFPNALDLIQISVEAGLGFDAAMIRVGNELEVAAPEISQELLAAQREIAAGRSRERALLDMAARTGVDEVMSFANVVLQAMQFGTSMSETLTTYAKEMRMHRELRAQEKANKLPVQMSAIMASLMLPALILLTLGPVVIRYIRSFSG